MSYKIKIGIDEAGRGPWLGPVVACAFCFHPENRPDETLLQQLTDSKKLSEKKREELYEVLVSMSTPSESLLIEGEARGELGEDAPQVFFGVGVVDNFVIDEINIRQANREAMRRAIIELQRKLDLIIHPSIPSCNSKGKEDFKVEVFIDGKDNYEFDELEKKPVYIVGGDAKVLEISAASIIAKVFRDKLILTYASLYPNLGLEGHKGYGTKKHQEQLQEKKDITGIHRLSYKPVKAVLEKKPKLLLHICCGPDATVPIMDLKQDYEVICFWYDPNIQPKKEYDKRLKAFKRVCEIEGVEWIEGEYDVENFFKKIKGLEHTPEKGDKCTECYDMRLERTAYEAEKLGIHYWTSTLNTSPHKDLEKMFRLGDKHSMKKNLEFLKIAFRKNNGFLRSVEYTTKHKIYRQNYCGCVYSDTFPGNEKKGISPNKNTWTG